MKTRAEGRKRGWWKGALVKALFISLRGTPISVKLGLCGVLIILAQFLVFTAPCHAESIDSIASGIRTVEELASWMSKNLKYQWTIPDSPQTLQETLASKKGDCEDFANLASAILARKGINSEIIVLTFKGPRIYHAVCVWKRASGAYSLMSNTELYKTDKKTVEEAVTELYPDREKILKLADVRRSGW